MGNCRNCGCNKISCGCKDTYLTTPPPCPTPVDCPEAQPCSEVFDAQCIIYTGENILCEEDIVVTQNNTVAQGLVSIVNYFCEKVPLLTAGVQCIEQPIGFISPEGTPFTEAIQDVVDYFCDALANVPLVEVVAGDNIIVTSNIVGNLTTYTVNGLETIVEAGANVSVVPVVVGNTTTYTVSAINTGGLPPWTSVGAGVFFVPVSLTLTINTRVVYTIQGATYVEYSLPNNPVFGTEIEFVHRSTSDFYINPGLPATNTDVEIWSNLGTLTASAGVNRLFWDSTTSSTENVKIRLLCIQNTGAGKKWIVIEQTWNDQVVQVVV
jgi:hypothetical protein